MANDTPMKTHDFMTEALGRISAHIERHCAKLGLLRTCPYKLHDSGSELEFAAYLPQFGGPRGMLVVAQIRLRAGNVTDLGRYFQAAHQKDLYCSACVEGSVVDESEFVGVLQDWGFYGRPEDLRPEVLELVTRPSPWADPPTK